MSPLKKLIRTYKKQVSKHNASMGKYQQTIRELQKEIEGHKTQRAALPIGFTCKGNYIDTAGVVTKK